MKLSSIVYPLSLFTTSAFIVALCALCIGATPASPPKVQYAEIKNPSGASFTVLVKEWRQESHGMVIVTTSDDHVYITSIVNVLLKDTP